MLDINKLPIFMTFALTLLVIPGPAVLYIVARSIDQGKMAGLVSVFGIQLGAMVHITAAALGLSALLMSSALAFGVVKWLGAGYLVYLGIHKLFFEKTPDHTEVELEISEEQSLQSVFTQGVVVNVLNPKTALFFFAFLPQFVDPIRGSVVIQILLLGLIFITMATMSDSLYALLAGSLGDWLKRNRNILKGQRIFSGIVYIGLGLATAFSGGDGK